MRAPVYFGNRQTPKSHRSLSHVAIHMLTANRIRLSLSLQAPFSLLPGSSLCDFRLVIGRHHPRSRSRYTQGLGALFAPASVVLDTYSHAAIGQMGCSSRSEWHVPKGDEVLAPAKRWQALSHWGYDIEAQTGTAASLGTGHPS